MNAAAAASEQTPFHSPPPTTGAAALISIFTSFWTYHIDIIKAPSQPRTHSLSSPFYTFLSLSLSLCLCTSPFLSLSHFSLPLSLSLPLSVSLIVRGFKRLFIWDQWVSRLGFSSRRQKPVGVSLFRMKELDIFPFLPGIAGSRLVLVNLKKWHAAHSVCSFQKWYFSSQCNLGGGYFLFQFQGNPAKDFVRGKKNERNDNSASL